MTCATCGTGSGTPGPLPGDPSGIVTLSATSVFGGIQLFWSYPSTNPHAVAHTQVYVSTVNDFATATLLGIAAGSSYFDRRDVVQTYYYWIKIVSINGTVGPLVGPASAAARTVLSDLLEQLTTHIDEGVLATALRDTLGGITTLNTNLLNEITARENANVTLAAAIAAANADAASALTFIADEVTSRTDADSAAIEAISVAAATLEGHIAAVEVSTTASIGTLDGKVTDIGALYTVQVTADGLAGGFGIYNNGTLIEAGFDVDLFWVGKTSTDKVKPFVISGGVVYIKSAMIQDASIGSAKIANVIASDNYVAGVSGWMIRKSDGYAEFGNTVVRGSIQANSLTANSVYTGNINVEQVTAARYVDAYDSITSSSYVGDITTAAINSQGALVLVDWYLYPGFKVGNINVQLYRDSTLIYSGLDINMPAAFGSDASPHTYTMRFQDPAGGTISTRWLKVQALFR